jgi:hypothetical protein
VRAAAVIALIFMTALASCGSSDDTASPTHGSVGAGTLQELWNRPGENVSLLMGTADYAPGPLRVSFGVVTHASRLIERPTARFWLARGLDQKPFQQGTARLERMGPGLAVYVAHVNAPEPGDYTLLGEPVGGTTKVQGVGSVVVRDKSASPAVGSEAFPSENPTVKDQPAEKITTARPPDTALLQLSVKDALERREPFVVAFATPQFCQSRTCGPAVEIVDKVRKEFTGTPVRFIHIEIYKDNNPALGANRWVQEWRLPSEPWVFLVGRDGKIKAKFEGPFSTQELSKAVRRFLA